MEHDKEMIKFSVVIPLYNKEKEIVDTINSVLEQSCQSDEIIVIDDGSTDRGVEQIRDIFGDSITIITQKNQGVSSARNRGIQEAKNEYICLLDGDDLWREDFLKEITLLIEKFSTSTFYSTAHTFIDENGDFVREEENIYQKEIYDFARAFSTNYALINSSSVCIRKSSQIEFPSDEKRGEDICVWLEL
jgi:glycosyltransferase involved in cell wall biosynthesis